MSTNCKALVIFSMIILSFLHVKSEETTAAVKQDEEDPVIVLSSDNFTENVQNERIILVEFYAPWCGHCKSLAPEYKVAARQLKALDPPIPLAKVDATSNEDLALQYEINGYPTMKVFRKGVPYEYEGPRKADGIIKYMKNEARPDWKPPVDQVLVLTKDNFTDITHNSPLILVEFYAPWCGHCKQLAPQYKKAADILHRANTNIKLAKVDATVEGEIAKQYGVEGYPTMKIFRAGEVFEYSGPRDTQGIVGYMMKQSEPPTSLILSTKELNNELKGDTPLVFGFFNSEESPQYEAYAKAANEGREEPLVFRHSVDVKFAQKYKVDVNSVVVFLHRRAQSQHEPIMKRYTGSLDVSPEELIKSLKDLSKPLVGYRSRSNVESVFSHYPVLVGYISNEDEEDSFDYWRSKFIPLTKKYPEITFAISDEGEFKEELKMVGLGDKMEDIVVVLWTSQKEKYIYTEDEVTTDNINEFISDYKDGNLKPFLRSQPKPTKQTGPVTVVVGSTFQEIVEDTTRDVFIEFYAPWCGHCKALAPIYKSLAKKYKDNNKLVIAKFDATVNDAPGKYEFQGFPTIFFVAAGQDTKPVVYEGGRTVADMSKYLEENAHVSFGTDKDEL